MYLEIPIQIGYNIIKTKKFDIDLTTGISLGFLTQSNGFYLIDGSLQQSSSKSINFNYLLTADLKYHFTPKIGISLSPQFKYNILNMSTLKATKRNYTSIGINAGVFVKF